MTALQSKISDQAHKTATADEMRFQHLLESVSDYIYTVQIDNGHASRTIHGPACVTITGYTPREFEADPYLWYRMIREEDRPLVIATIGRLLAGDAVQPIEHRITHKCGSLHWVRTVYVSHKDDRGNLIAYDGVINDITERKLAEKALEQQFARVQLLNQIARAVTERQQIDSMLRVVLRQMVEGFPVDAAAFLKYDRETDLFTIHLQDAKSAALAAELGLTEGAKVPVEETGLRLCLTGETLSSPEVSLWPGSLAQKLAHHDLGSGVATPLAADDRVFGILVVLRRESGGFTSGEVDFVRQLCEHVALAMHHAQLYENLQAAYDELRSTQQALLQQERLRALGQMASGIAHDINNALSPVMMFPELMLQREPNLSPQGRHYLEMIQQAAGDIAQIVARMREFYRSREEQEMLLPLGLNNVVKEVIDLTHPRWSDIPQKSGLTIRIETALMNSLPNVLGVESELRQLLTNLIINAVEAMPAGGTITIGTAVAARETGTAGEPGNTSRVILSVRDTGIGMDEETKLHCLEPFYTKKAEGGTGLGLAMVYGIVKRHDAGIEIESAPGRGTIFRLLFPLPSEAVTRSTAAAMPTKYDGPLLRILCIDDEPMLRSGLKNALEADGHTVECADGGQTGLEALRTAVERGEPFQAVITDLGMPHMDGREVARTVKLVSPGTPVILLTGWGPQVRSESALPEGVDRILNKPPKIVELWEALKEVVR